MCYYGFLRCSGVGRRARHLRRPFSLSLEESPLQALKNAPVGQRFSHPPPPHPSHADACYGASRKNPPPSAEKYTLLLPKGAKEGPSIPAIVLVSIAIASPAVRGGFFWPKAPSTLSACEGCGGGRAMNARPVGQRCLALAKRSEPGAAEGAAGACPRGCERGPDGEST